MCVERKKLWRRINLEFHVKHNFSINLTGIEISEQNLSNAP